MVRLAKSFWPVAGLLSILIMAVIYSPFTADDGGEETKQVSESEESQKFAGSEVFNQRFLAKRLGDLEQKVDALAELIAAQNAGNEDDSEPEPEPEADRGSDVSFRVAPAAAGMTSSLVSESSQLSDVKHEGWFWNQDSTGQSPAFGSLGFNYDSMNCRGAWCRLSMANESLAKISENNIPAELVLFEQLTAAAGGPLEIRQPASPPKGAGKIFYIKRISE